MLRLPAFLLVATLVSIAKPHVFATELFPDKGLDAAVRRQVYEKRNNDEPLTKDDVKDISIIHGNGAEIESLEGIQHCLAVQEIRFADNKISDLSPLGELKQLQSLTLSGNQIDDISPLAELTKLQYLNVEDNQISKLAPLAKLTAMRSLYLSNNKIERLGALKDMKKLWSLYVGGNPIKAAKVVRRLEFVDTLGLQNCSLENVEFITPMKRLRTVYLMNNKLSELSTFVSMVESDKQRRLMQIYVEGNPLDAQQVETQVEKLRKLGARVHLGEKVEQAKSENAAAAEEGGSEEADK